MLDRAVQFEHHQLSVFLMTKTAKCLGCMVKRLKSKLKMKLAKIELLETYWDRILDQLREKRDEFKEKDASVIKLIEYIEEVKVF